MVNPPTMSNPVPDQETRLSSAFEGNASLHPDIADSRSRAATSSREYAQNCSGGRSRLGGVGDVAGACWGSSVCACLSLTRAAQQLRKPRHRTTPRGLRLARRSFPLEQFLSTGPLAVLAVADLQPGRLFG